MNARWIVPLCFLACRRCRERRPRRRAEGRLILTGSAAITRPYYYARRWAGTRRRGSTST